MENVVERGGGRSPTGTKLNYDVRRLADFWDNKKMDKVNIDFPSDSTKPAPLWIAWSSHVVAPYASALFFFFFFVAPIPTIRQIDYEGS